MKSDQRDGEDQRHRADFEEREHEKDGPAACPVPDRPTRIMIGAAEAHGLPGDQEGGAVLQAEHAERAGMRLSAAPNSQPRPPPVVGEPRRRRISPGRGRSPSTTVPAAATPKSHPFPASRPGERYRLARIRKAASAAGGHAERRRRPRANH